MLESLVCIGKIENNGIRKRGWLYQEVALCSSKLIEECCSSFSYHTINIVLQSLDTHNGTLVMPIE
jgi:hypothetical protein